MSIPESALNYGSILTFAGENAEINGKLNSKPINFTHIAIGDANDVYVQPSRTQTALVHELARIPITGMEKITPSKPDAVPQLKVWAKIPDDIVDIAVREFAAVATFDGTSYLHAVGNTVRIPILSGSNNGGEVNDIYIEMTFAVTSLDPIVMIDPTIVTATRKFVKDEDAKHLAAADPHPQYLSLTRYEKDALSFKQEWSPFINYGIGHEVVRNGLRYIARAASGPDNGGAKDPYSDKDLFWDLSLPISFSANKNFTPNESWVKIAVVDGELASDPGGGGDGVLLSVFGASDYGSLYRFYADIIFSERAGQSSVIIIPKSLGLDNPEFYTKQISSRKYELWMNKTDDYANPLTVTRQSDSFNRTTEVGILERTSITPKDLTLVPYDTGHQFASIPIGMEVAFDTPPPTNDPRFRFVKLTADDAYNGSLLNNKVISGTAPNLVVKMTVNSALSPINGQQIEMLNTMGAIPTPGLTSGEIIQDAIRNIVGTITTNNGWMFNGATGPFGLTGGVQVIANATQLSGGTNVSPAFNFDASRHVPTAERVQVFSIVRPLYKRIY
ncbi:TPA: phage tail protein [Vibrio cholerae]